MKWLCVILIAGVALSAHGQVLQPIDPTQQADGVSHKFINTEQLTFPATSHPTYPVTDAPLTNKRVEPKMVDTPRVDQSTLHWDEVPTRTLPHQNFAAKRAAQSSINLDQPRVDTGAAPVTRRQIRANTPAGEEDLKKQLNKLP